jgi:hypothetical protein
VSIASKMRPETEDPVKVDPEHYSIELENERVRVLRVKFGPHEKSVMHGCLASLEINLTIAHLLVTYPDGRTENVHAKAGQVRLYPAAEKLPENLSDFPYEAIELK